MRSLQRSIKRAAERKDRALERYAVERYGTEVKLADLHPDVKRLFGIIFFLRESHKFGDTVAVANGFAALEALTEKYDSQKKEVLTEIEEAGTVEASKP